MSDKLKACRVLTDFDDDLDDRDSLEMEESCAECQLRLPCPDCATADAEIERLKEQVRVLRESAENSNTEMGRAIASLQHAGYAAAANVLRTARDESITVVRESMLAATEPEEPTLSTICKRAKALSDNRGYGSDGLDDGTLGAVV